ncbi:Uncharacterized protein dnm_019060 [Desulfonema magnum]|uniref:Uncharacterized protein n=1 Tax=Desulfonema magnum TaxID=45655 RepID=A0A975GLR0_9BACT|nr:Uncharacterized protein dnm_019060 [Desulfonema magnum]
MCLCGKYKNPVAFATKTRRHEENTKKLRETLCLCGKYKNPVAFATKTRRHEENTKKLRETLCLCGKYKNPVAFATKKTQRNFVRLCAFVANIRILLP